MPPRRSGYRSSPDKDIVREHFDLPLLRAFSDNKGEKLKYFGMPGAECRDILSWRDVLREVVAVERSTLKLGSMENLLKKHFIEIKSSVHHGDVDDVILHGRGNRRTHGKQSSKRSVANGYDQNLDRWIWEFDIVYLDYFGPFLPQESDEFPAARGKRDLALRHLFEQERLDARGSWVLLLTVEGGQYPQDDLRLLERYVDSARPPSSNETLEVLDYLLTEDGTPERRVTRLLHAVMALFVSSAASSAKLMPRPNGTVSYSGASGQSMIHSAFLLEKDEGPFGNYVNPLPLLRAPILRPAAEGTSSYFSWDQEPCPGTTKESVQECLPFLDPASLKILLSELAA